MARTENPTADASVSRNVPGGLSSSVRAESASKKRAETLDRLEEQFTEICTRFQALVASSSPELCATRPAPGSWSVAECLQHLNITADAYFPIWQQVIAAAGPRKTELNAPYRTDFWGRLLSWILEPPPRIRSKTPAHFEPVECNDVAKILDDFCDRQEHIVAALHRCRGRAIDQVKFASPLDARIRYSIWSSFVIIASHQRRHLWQAEQSARKLRAEVR